MARAVKAIEEEKLAEEEKYSGQSKSKQTRIATPGSKVDAASRRASTPRRLGL